MMYEFKINKGLKGHFLDRKTSTSEKWLKGRKKDAGEEWAQKSESSGESHFRRKEIRRMEPRVREIPDSFFTLLLSEKMK